MERTDKKVPAKTGHKVIRMYPNNGLKPPVRKFESTFSAVAVLKDMFFERKANA